MTDTSPASCFGLRVLVVDDHEDTRDLLQQVFTHEGATVVTASSAHEAVTSLDTVDAVVTDYSMPDGTGLWLLRQTQARALQVPVIMMTGYADVYLTGLSAAPFARVLLKPIDPWVLCREVRDVVRRTREAEP